MLTDPQTGARVSVVLYVCTSEDDTSDLITEHVQQYAHARDWPVTEAVRDHDRLQQLDQRPGWTRVLELLSNGARGIVTFSPPMVAADPSAFEELRRQIAYQGAFLVATRAERTLPRRTAGDVERRRNLVAAAAGWPHYSPHAGESTRSGQPSAELVARASHGWDAFLARTGPLPGEDGQESAAAGETER